VPYYSDKDAFGTTLGIYSATCLANMTKLPRDCK